MFNMLDNTFSRQHFEIFFSFLSQKKGMKCQNLFYEKNKKHMIKLLSAEFAHRLVTICFLFTVLVTNEYLGIICSTIMTLRSYFGAASTYRLQKHNKNISLPLFSPLRILFVSRLTGGNNPFNKTDQKKGL